MLNFRLFCPVNIAWLTKMLLSSGFSVYFCSVDYFKNLNIEIAQ